MSRLFLLDTNTVSHILSGKSPAARARLEALGVGDIVSISSITAAELRYGLAKKPNTKLRMAVENFLDGILVLPWGEDESKAYGMLRAAQEAKGEPLGNLDTLIAAHAVSRSAIMVTSDGAFRRVALLREIVSWADDV